MFCRQGLDKYRRIIVPSHESVFKKCFRVIKQKIYYFSFPLLTFIFISISSSVPLYPLIETNYGSEPASFEVCSSIQSVSLSVLRAVTTRISR